MEKHNIKFFTTERKIEDSLISLLKENQLNKITIADIITQAQVGRSTFYEHFYDKYEIIEHIFSEYSEWFNEIAKKRFSDQLFLTETGLEQFVTEILTRRDELNILLYVNANEQRLDLIFRKIMRSNIAKNIKLEKSVPVSPNYLIDLYTDISMSMINYQLEKGLDLQAINFASMMLKQLSEQIKRVDER